MRFMDISFSIFLAFRLAGLGRQAFFNALGQALGWPQGGLAVGRYSASWSGSSAIWSILRFLRVTTYTSMRLNKVKKMLREMMG
jgi:hypothetical protein